MSSLQEKLARLSRVRPEAPPVPPPPPASPERLSALEQSMLGEIQDGLSLKERLQRLVAVAGARVRRPEVTPIENLVAGQRVENERGEFFVVEDEIHLERFHGQVPLARLRTVDAATVGILSGDPALASFDLTRAVFLDTETTGLSGGAGTAAFLVGVGFVDGDVFRLRQYLMRDYDEEPAMVHALVEDLSAFTHLVTYNGKAFDVPLLESRFRMCRERWPLGRAPHLDLLAPARRLWKLRLQSCRLQSLEVALMGLERHEDVPGEEIPRIYFDYVRRRDGRALAGVLEHNRQDVISLAALCGLAGQWVAEGHAEDPRDVWSLARVLERAELHERSEEHYRRAASADAPDEVRLPSLRRLASHARRRGDHHGAAAFLGEAAQSGDVLALRSLAIHHEHRSRDLMAALDAVARAERGLRHGPGTWASDRALADDLAHRRARLQRKLNASIS